VLPPPTAADAYMTKVHSSGKGGAVDTPAVRVVLWIHLQGG
jgi:hypothetical protein